MATDSVNRREAVLILIYNAPGQRCRRTIIHAIEPTANAPESTTDGDSRCKQVTETQERKAVFPSVEVCGQDSSGEPTKERQASFPERRNSPRMGQIVDEIVLHYKVDPSAKDRSNQNPGQQA